MDMFDVIGSYGPWQRRTFAVFFYMNIVGVWQTLSVTFLAPNVDFECVEPQSMYTPVDNHTTFDGRCEVLFANGTLEKCTRWEYDVANFSRNIVSEWDLVCDRQWLVSLAKSVYMFGFLASVFIFGQMSDWLGRFATIVTCYTINITAMFLSMLSSSYTMFAVFRFLQAFGRTGMSTTGIVLVMEMMGPDHRAKAGILIQVGWAFGFITLVPVAWFIRNWFWFQFALGMSLLPVAFCFRIIPESPRWLLMRGKKDQLERLLKEAASLNKRQLKQEVKDMELFKGNDDQKAKTLIHLLKMPKMRKRAMIMIYLWIVNAFTYYGLSFNTNDFAGDPYLNFFISGLIEFPSYALMYWGALKVGRRPTFLWLTFVGGAACVAILAVPGQYLWLQTTFAMIGKLCVNGSFGLLYLYTSELFPTVVRNAALGTCSMCARVGSILAPFVRELGLSTHTSVPNVLYGVLALTSGSLALLVPETKGSNMPDTMEEGEAFGVSPSSGNDPKLKLEPDTCPPLLLKEMTDINGKLINDSNQSH
ncbi:hypothetical protein JTE90_006971 [Oedothorax gibbosus]|uniref:Major facilitator superfamily (MFS) profile domain-containing protein n=1 Tax=Oedothorax gibbosus TaxID=931172 RepID=A0AAV6V908_9ARAC|nr:hypothetical protein JTE90_006971 [Oedothorax gibbosus]